MKNTLKEISDFITDVAIDDTYTSIGTVNRITKSIKGASIAEDLTDVYGKSNLFFLSNVNNNDLLRSKYGDISKRKYLFFDIDLRKDLKLGDTEDLTPHIDKILNKLKGDKVFCQWSYVVFSGNGIHIYYIDDKYVDIDGDKGHSEMKMGVIEACEAIENIIGYEVDRGAAKISQIIRLPGTINKKDGLSEKECYIYKKNTTKYSEKFNILEFCKRIGVVEYAEKKSEEKKRRRDRLKKQKDGDTSLASNSFPDIVIEFANGDTQRFGDVQIESGITKPCKCPNPAHDDKHASAYVGRSPHGDSNCFVNCSGGCDLIWNG